MIITSIFLFGALAYFIEGKYTIIHNILIYGYMTLWVIGQILIAYSIGNIGFTVFTFIFLLTPLIIGFWSLYKRTTSVLIQALDLFFVYSWLIVFVFRYL
jgi:ABC-type proline/glycine betaine transport system permease subunit